MDYILIKKQRYFFIYFLFWGPYTLVYELTNRCLLFSPTQLEFSWLDNALPFVSFLVPVYVSYLLFGCLILANSQDNWELNDLFYLTHFQLVVCALFFVFFPVTFPRHDYYVTSSITKVFLDFWLWFDAPNNCFPSLHTANCALAIHYSLGKKWQWLFCIWGVLIIISTVLCKQHYVVDLVAGLCVYLLTIRFKHWVLDPWKNAAKTAA
ncbi:MAG: phosphatase PAP2 family protein [Desulfatibacillum sp.]|nr:phosphatase PAP2 family protein [Desulfatibacillum sp.]